MKLIRVDKLVSSLGYCNRKDVARLIKSSIITHIENIDIKPDTKVYHSDILYNNEPLDPMRIVLVMNKPLGYICSHDSSEGKTIYELLPERYRFREPKISTIGRLDKDTSGLILLTDDGKLNHYFTAPKNGIKKVYIAYLDRELDESAIEIFGSGKLLLKGEKTPCLPAKLEILEKKIAKIEIYEGRYHQVRRMFAAISNHVVSLHRMQFGEYKIDDLREGEYRYDTNI